MGHSIVVSIFFIAVFSKLAFAAGSGFGFYKKAARVLFVEHNIHNKSSWTDIGATHEDSVKELIRILARSKTGKKILIRAKKKAASSGRTLLDIIKPGDGSLCDTTLIRRFSPERPDKIAYETKSMVYIDRTLPVIHAVLDIAHELTHYIYRTSFNPYLSGFNLKDFIVSTVEGRGGEVDAYMVECKVLYEIFPNEERDKSNCSRLLDDNGKLSRARGVEQFYRIGGYFKLLSSELRKYNLSYNDFPAMSGYSTSFISSAYGVPYPMAALKEFQSITEKVCGNDFKRLSLMKSGVSKPGTRSRSIASESGNDGDLYKKMKKAYQKRCRMFKP